MSDPNSFTLTKNNQQYKINVLCLDELNGYVKFIYRPSKKIVICVRGEDLVTFGTLTIKNDIISIDVHDNYFSVIKSVSFKVDSIDNVNFEECVEHYLDQKFIEFKQV